ncbi:MAG: hypothetical protein IKU95_02540, partial [Clostridia bacterium]|nr:hypothetical protein [Clostridia bacterium]
MKKRVFAMFTALSMTMTMLPAPALAGDLPNGLEQTSMISQELQQLEGVRISITPPMKGHPLATYPYVFAVDEGASFASPEARWYDAEGKRIYYDPVPADAATDTMYKLTFTLEAPEGFVFPEGDDLLGFAELYNAPEFLNAEVSVAPEGDDLFVSVIFHRVLTPVDITPNVSIPRPITGETPQNAVKADACDLYTLDPTTVWIDSDTYEIVEKFEEETEYVATLTFKAADGYAFTY